jgi:gas vesicle protein
MILSKEDALYASGIFESFFANFDRIDDYMRKIKMERMDSFPASLPGMGPESDLFDKFDMHPNDMEFVITECRQDIFMSYMEITTSAPVEASIPGKQMLWLVKEKNTGLVVGMIRFGSPTINSRPRNQWLGKPLETTNPEAMKRFNESAIMGFNIVPAQPFGYNYLGGKLLAAICCSHKVRRAINKKYGSNICMFETTSLYGSSSAASMYDGMRPFLRHNGLTDSNFAPMINDDNFRTLNEWFRERNGGVLLVPADASSRKLRTQTKMASIIKSSLKQHDEDAYAKFCQIFDDAKNLTEKKRSYFSTYGYDAQSVKDYLNLKTTELKKADNYDRFEIENVIDWWRKKATKRFESINEDGRLRTKLETWNTNADEIDIIR